jgi:uncharacterized membrane protein
VTATTNEPERPDGDPACTVRAVPVSRPFTWLSAGVRDLARAPGPSLLHGLVVAVAGIAILALSMRAWPLLPGAFSGFVLIAPILATGLYELSRRLEEGEEPTFAHVLGAWARGTRPLVWMGLGLALAATLWVLVSAVLVALFVHAPITGPREFLRLVIVGEGSNLFPLWLTLGGVGAAVVFAATVVSVPLLLDREIGLGAALATSVRAVGENPVTMALWAAMIMLLTFLSMATFMLGFAVTIPVIGHATWHAYRDVVDASALPRRT